MTAGNPVAFNILKERLRTPASPMGVSIKYKLIQKGKNCTCPYIFSSRLLFSQQIHLEFGQEFFSYPLLKFMLLQCIDS